MDVATLTTALDAALPGSVDRLRLAERLLDHALRERDAATAQMLAGLMDAEPVLDEALWPRLNRHLSTLPDAAYAFIRAHVSARPDVDERWLVRLKSAALAALRVAILDTDTDTLLNWLKLIAREPAYYGLSEVLRNAIPAAHAVARQRGTPPDLARGLIIMAARRDPSCAQGLLTDTGLLAALPDPLGPALRDQQGDPAVLLNLYGSEVLLMALHRAAARRATTLFTPFAVETVWSLTHSEGNSAAAQSAAATILADWLNGGDGWLHTPALTMLLTLALRDQRDDQFLRLVRALRERADFPALLATAFSRSARPVADVLALTAQLLAIGDLTLQGAVDVYVLTLNDLEWEPNAQPMIAALARSVAQNNALDISDEALWRLVEVAADLRDEGILRAASRRAEARLSALTDDVELLDHLVHLVALVGTSSARAPLETWWRSFVAGQPVARLHRLDRQFEGRKGLDDLRHILQSVVAFRRMMGNRTLAQFADEVNAAFGILQAFGDSFEPQPRRAAMFDPAAIRAEIEAQRGDLAPERMQILASDLKGLAELIAELGDNRSKAGLIRRSEDVDRQLITGEQSPHGAVDAMKWMSGYLSGAQDDAGEDEE